MPTRTSRTKPIRRPKDRKTEKRLMIGQHRWIFLALSLGFFAHFPTHAADVVPPPVVPPGQGSLRFFPLNDVFRPLIADPKERQFFMSMLRFKSPDKSSYTVWSVGFGESLGLARWERGAFQAQVGFLAGVFSQFNWSTPSKDLINTDFNIGLAGTHRWHSFTGRFQYYHQSSHLGDELLLNNPIPRLNYAYEAVEEVLAVENSFFRVYGGGEYLVERDPTFLKRWTLRTGAELRGEDSPAFFRPVGGLDVMWKEQHPGRPNVSIKAGVEVGKAFPRNRRIRLLAEFYNGYSPFGQFFDQKTQYAGLGFYIGF